MRIAGLIALLVTLFNVPLKFSRPPEDAVNESLESALEKIWVDSVFTQLSEEERLGQLFIVRAYSNKGTAHEQEIEDKITKQHVGGVIFFQGSPEKQVELTNKYQAKAKVPLMIAMDAEWGLGMRFPKQTINFPRQLTLGAIQKNKLIYDFGKEVARQCKRIGVNINFAPVVDINNNPDNPVINDRSFGEDRLNVAAKGYMYARGLQDNNVMACAKHFPGHGDTNVDSHYDLPVIKHSKERLDSIELYPFKVLAQTGLASMMMGHLSIPVIDSTANLPSSLSRRLVTDMLHGDFDFSGLIFTDGLDMAGVTKYYKNGQGEVKALQAGNDILLLPNNLNAAITAIKKAVKDGELSRTDIDSKVRKMLKMKYRFGLHRPQNLATTNVKSDLNTPQAYLLKKKLYENAITVVRNPQKLIPLRNLDTLSIATLSIGSSSRTDFQRILDHYAPMSHYNSGKEVSASLHNSLKNKDVVIVGLHNMSKSSKKNFGITQGTRNFLNKLSKETKVIVNVFGSPYSLKYFDDIPWLVACYENDDLMQEKAAQMIFGAVRATGRLPITASEKSQFGMGEDTDDLLRIQYDRPEAAGFVASKLNAIDEIAAEAIRLKATPGCQVLVAKNRKIVFHKSYGHHNYNKRTTVSNSDIYDLASVTKIAATTMSLMNLQEEGKIDLYQTLGTYMDIVKGTNKEHLRMRDILALSLIHI